MIVRLLLRRDYVVLADLPTEVLLAELHRRIAAAPLYSQSIPQPLRRERLS